MTNSIPRVEPDLPLDPGIRAAVHALNDAGILTEESCEGGIGHAFPEPTIRFGADYSEALHAVAAAISAGLRVQALKKTWRMDDGELLGPLWELTFKPERPWWSPSGSGPAR